jgi:hypothetical protein
MAMDLKRVIVSSAEVDHNPADKVEGPTRKDIATTFTRKLVFECVPDLPSSESYQAIREVVIHRQHMEEPWSQKPADHFLWMESHFNRYLKVIAPSISFIDSLHLKLCTESPCRWTYDSINSLNHCFESAIRCTYEVTGAPWHDSTALCAAYDLQCVLTFRDYGISQERRAGYIASCISECFEEEDLDTSTGQLFLCDIPSLVLNPRELASAADVNEAAIIKICDLVTVYPDLTGSIYKTKLDFFKSRIKLVKPGFKPTLADLYPRPQPKSVISSLYIEVS